MVRFGSFLTFAIVLLILAELTESSVVKNIVILIIVIGIALMFFDFGFYKNEEPKKKTKIQPRNDSEFSDPEDEHDPFDDYDAWAGK
jgi:hypothetical protein